MGAPRLGRDWHEREIAMLRKVEQAYQPVAYTTDWKADTKAALRSARIGSAILLALVTSTGWAMYGWLVG